MSTNLQRSIHYNLEKSKMKKHRWSTQKQTFLVSCLHCVLFWVFIGVGVGWGWERGMLFVLLLLQLLLLLLFPIDLVPLTDFRYQYLFKKLCQSILRRKIPVTLLPSIYIDKYHTLVISYRFISKCMSNIDELFCVTQNIVSILRILGHITNRHYNEPWYLFQSSLAGCLNVWADIMRQHDKTQLQWRHNESDGASNHRQLNRLFRRRSKKTSKLRVTDFMRGIH